ncbi:MAG: ATP-binding protein [Acidobacteriota bacterium]
MNQGVSHKGYLSLIERKTLLRIYMIASIATMVLWLCEGFFGIGAAHDRWAQPVLALLMLSLYATLQRYPQSLVMTQRIAVFALAVYFVASSFSVLFRPPNTASPYFLANNLLWMPMIALVLQLAFPWRWAVGISLGLLALVALPAVLMEWFAGEAAWRGVMQSFLINGVLMQLTFLFCLMSVDRLKNGIGLIVAGRDDGPLDAQQALESWVQERTEELAQAKEEAEAASQAKSRFLAVMSHELRTPLHAMLVSADLLSDRAGLPVDEARDTRLIDTIQTSGHHLLGLIDQILDLSRIESGQLRPHVHVVDLESVLRKACDAVKPLTEAKGLRLLTGVAADLPPMRMGDELRLTQILINLLGNASKFTMQGHIAVSIRATPEAPVGEDWVRFSVIDTGPGMDEAHQLKVFEAFYQIDNQATRQHQGVGLGLTITQELVTLMHGRLQLRSTPGLGTRIDIDLPLPPAKAPQPELSAKTPTTLVGHTVLVADDDDLNCMLASDVLSQAGAIVHTLGNGASVLAFLKTHRPSVVLMDWQMPGMDGLEATRRLRAGEAGELSRDVPVVGLTANAFSQDREACLAAGMNAILTKPVNRQQMLQELALWATKEPLRDVISRTPRGGA